MQKLSRLPLCISLLCIVAIITGGCVSSGPGAYFNDRDSDTTSFVDSKLKDVKMLAIMPFKAPTELIGSSVSDMFITEILKTGKCSIVERSRLSQVLGESELSMSGMSTGRAAEVGRMLGADAVMTGTVIEYATVAQKGKTYPVVAVTARIVDASTSQIIASVDLAEQSSSATTPLSGHARNVVHKMMSDIYQLWR